MDISQAFDRVWIGGLLHKISLYKSHQTVNILKSYIQNRHFGVQYSEITLTMRSIQAGVPQGSVLGLLLYTLYVADVPLTERTIMATFLAPYKNYDAANNNL